MREDFVVCVVEVGGAFASKFKVLLLILADGDVSGSSFRSALLMLFILAGRFNQPAHLCTRMSAA